MSKVYILDQGWEGAVIIFAESHEDALAQFKETATGKALITRYPNPCFEEYEIHNGLLIETIGDL